MEWLITNAVATLLLPPASLLLLAACGALLARRRPGLGRSLVAFSLLALYVLASPIAADALLASLEPPARDPLAGRRGQVIVVLGGGTYFSAPEYGGDTVSDYTLVRLRYAARLHRESELPILVTGGAPLGNAVSEAEQMAATLKADFRVPVRWIEKRAANTLENARLTGRMLEGAGIRRVYLVTHAWHMPRAQLAFAQSGLEAIPAPTAYTTRYRLGPIQFLPSAAGLAHSSRYFHEIIGTGWYHLRILLGR